MAATVLSSPVAVEMSIHVVRAFARLRKLLATNTEFAKRLGKLEGRIKKKLGTHDRAIAEILAALRRLTSPSARQRRLIGFTTTWDDTPK